ncbi:uncharacterized protein [Apostichopus japonicus]|uniref:uncharacterized protein isoform X2 n=1 Tax=Stichopus japonicus TaxID=307972 RepID=UPI003AB8DD62
MTLKFPYTDSSEVEKKLQEINMKLLSMTLLAAAVVITLPYPVQFHNTRIAVIHTVIRRDCTGKSTGTGSSSDGVVIAPPLIDPCNPNPCQGRGYCQN